MSRSRGRPPKYDWSIWGDGDWHLAVEGEDFTCSLVSFRALVSHTARKQGGRAETDIDRKEGKLMFRFVDLP